MIKWHQIKSLFSFAKSATKFGATFATKKCQEARLEICATCPNIIGGKNGLACGICGCHLHNKIRPTASTCPIGKWGVGENTTYKETFLFLISSLIARFKKPKQVL